MARYLLLIILLICPSLVIWPSLTDAAQGATPSLLDYRVGGTSSETRLVLDFSQAVKFSVALRTDGGQLVVTLPKLSATPDFAATKGSLLIKTIRAEAAGGQTSLLIDLNRAAALKQSFAIPARDGKPFRIVIDLLPQQNRPEAAIDPAPAVTTSGTLQEKTVALPKSAPKAVSAAASQKSVKPAIPTDNDNDAPAKSQKHIIVIDAGHGGPDGGATGEDGSHEKNITLAMAKELKRQLAANPAYKIYLTRETDIFIPLKGRRDIARNRKADLFISLHADSMGSGDGTVRGASFYTLSNEASDAMSAKLATRENKADLIGGIDVGVDDADVAGILIDLTMRETMNQSKRFASNLSRSFTGNSIKLLDKPMRAAGFAVLKAPDVPAVLIEMGFLSSPDDVRLLQSPPYQAKLAGSIAKGVNQYFDYLDTRN